MYELNQTPYDYTVAVTNRFKGFNLIDRVPEELWTEGPDGLQSTGSQRVGHDRVTKQQQIVGEAASWLPGAIPGSY